MTDPVPAATHDSTEALTTLLHRHATGESGAMALLMPRVYAELHRAARRQLQQERADHTLQPTALVNEVFLRLAERRELELNDRAHFIRLAAQIMRHVLVDHARAQRALKRGGDVAVTSLDHLERGDGLPLMRDDDEAEGLRMEMDFLALDAALDKLAGLSERQVQVVNLRYFGGLSIEEVGETLDLSPATVKRDWTMARLFLRRELEAAQVAPR
ncbi:MAG: sigma-70 family RNA polymerase sigma factor [Rudaea sp.]|uniref:ECF-type sigma factor n=1 Tax=unclassified Rudaea TaxID=2627037 RepID=UPI0010FA4B61|nr:MULTISPECIES: ECF-type sigma factor [unclassified Rudaea]MBN8887506.1 sigma-70 family RNA polymerase sigma factor [Rudaea sp.]MBR0345391.1 sigma-70 family RNA polymerase sigma factor [Rudaea sp.]